MERTPLFQKVYSGQPISDERLRQLIGDAPLPAYNRDGDRYAMETGPMPNDPLGRMPIPAWAGRDIATKVKPWLEELKSWRELTINSVHPKLAGCKLQMSFPEDSWMRRCANMVPRNVILSPHCWDLILKEIIYGCKQCIDAELDIALERFLLTKKRPNGLSFDQFLTRLKKLRESVCNILGHEEIKRPHREHVEWKEEQMPEEIWSYLIMKNCETTK